MDDSKFGSRNIFVVRVISDLEIRLVRHNESRRMSDMERGGDTNADIICARGEGKFEKLREWNCRKAFVDVLGKVHG